MAGLNVKKGDRVVVVTGKDKGKQGEVIAAFPSEERVVVQGVNKVKKHQRATAANPGGIVEQEASIHVSNVAHVDPKDNKPTRIGVKILEDGSKVRVAKRSGEVIDR
ncbi:MAG: 50S ribosomal protein L24 [Magnetospirillum sp.]|nr:50S ribosomal protein L24 [Magnetospirillum sp.]